MKDFQRLQVFIKAILALVLPQSVSNVCWIYARNYHNGGVELFGKAIKGP